MLSRPHKKSIQKLHLKSLTRVIDMYNTPLGTSLEAKCLLPQAMLLELEAIRGHRSAHSFATGPVTVEPFISPLLLTITPALSSKYKNSPSFLRKGFRCLTTTAGITFFLSSGFPFFTVASTKSPAPAAGSRFSRPLIPFTAMTYRFLAPVLSAQFITAPTGSPTEMRNLAPDAPFFPVRRNQVFEVTAKLLKRVN